MCEAGVAVFGRPGMEYFVVPETGPPGSVYIAQNPSCDTFEDESHKFCLLYIIHRLSKTIILNLKIFRIIPRLWLVVPSIGSCGSSVGCTFHTRGS